jgi:hypothetical protein
VIKTYRMKPVIKDAIQFTPENWNDIQTWMLDYNGSMTWEGSIPDRVSIQTHMGTMDAMRGDWIVRGLEGEFYPVQDSKFQATYEEIE